jgi:hypothetical protein
MANTRTTRTTGTLATRSPTAKKHVPLNISTTPTDLFTFDDAPWRRPPEPREGASSNGPRLINSQ